MPCKVKINCVNIFVHLTKEILFMNTPAENALDIDDLLEQVALAMASGENDTALELLPQIIVAGDDVQKQMAESYQIQLEALIALEKEAAELTELLDHDEGSLVGANEAESAAGDNHEHVAVLNADNATPAAVLDSEAETQTADSEEHILTGMDDISETVVKDSVAGDFSDNAVHSSETQEFTAREQQINMELEQVAVLIKEHEYETANMLLQSILPKGNAAQQELAQTYTAAIKQAASEELAREELAREEPAAMETAPDKAVKEQTTLLEALTSRAIDEEQTASLAEQVDSDKDQQSDSILDRLFADEDPDAVFNQLFADEEPQSVSNKLFEDDSDQAESSQPFEITEVSADKLELLSQPSAVNAPEPEILDSEVLDSDILNSDIVTEQEIVSEQETSSNNLTTPAVTAETFADNEAVEGLLPPSQALDAFTFSDIDALPEQSTTTAVKNQRQGFFIGDIGLMVDFADGSELTEIPTYYRVPNAPDWLAGLTNLHGIVIPVFDLQKYFNLPTEKNKKRMLMVLQHEEKAIGIIVNGLPTRLTYSESQRMTNNTSPSNLSRYIQSAYLIDQHLWFELDSSSLARGLERAIA